LAGNPDPDTLAAVNRGIQLGNLLGKRLSVRSEVNVTKYMRKSMGKIDRRVLAELGIDNENVFYRNEIDQFKHAYLHLSIDASSSMLGDKWRKTITAATAICKAASMINNLKVSVSIRATSRGNSLPYIAMVYDSTKDSFAKVRNMFPYLVANGSTPEGLCFEAIMDMLRDKEENEDCYFVNFSDGEPCYSYHKNNTYINYSYQNGANHTRKQVNEIRKKGYTVLSYYIGNRNENAQSRPHFKMMYGQDARYIYVTNIVSVAKTLNDMFLSSTSKI
jgi:nitric oxide reductase activation protein